MIDLTNYRKYLSDKAYVVIRAAIEETKKRNQYYLGVEHIFLAYARVENSFFNSAMTAYLERSFPYSGAFPLAILAAKGERCPGNALRCP